MSTQTDSFIEQFCTSFPGTAATRYGGWRPLRRIRSILTLLLTSILWVFMVDRMVRSSQNGARFMEQTLLLNATYEPLKVVDWRKAITLWCQGKVEVISVYDRDIRSVSVTFKQPSVIRLLSYITIRRRFNYAPFSRSNIYARDNQQCQYCGRVFPVAELTFDHVIPVSQGGRKDWENIVTSCVVCNPAKGRPHPSTGGPSRHSTTSPSNAPTPRSTDDRHRYGS